MIKFYDTCSLLRKAGSLFADNEPFVISSITLEELENIKTSTNRDNDIKYSARVILRQLDAKPFLYQTITFTNSMLDPIITKDLPITNDTKILACALAYPTDVIFVTNDLALKTIARLFLKHIESVPDEDDDYSGVKAVRLSDEEMAVLYETPDDNKFDLLINQYLLVYNEKLELVDRLVRVEDGYRHLSYRDLDSTQFGCIRPMPNDYYQQCAVDSFFNNQITLIKGPAGSGKTLLSLGFLFNQLEKHRIDKVIVFCNTVAAMHSAKLGYYPGTKDEKLLDSQIGNLLISKLGGRDEVERLIEEEKLLLLPMSDIRGYDTTGLRAGVYISEAQNLDIPLMKLALQRIGDDSICIVDGDAKAQVDDINFAGNNNGMRRLSKIFRGKDCYGEVELQQVHRSKIGLIAEDM